MKFKDKLKLAIIYYRKSNKKVIYSIIVILCSILTLMILTVNTNYKKITKTIMASVEYRTLFVFPPEGVSYLTTELKNEILELNHVSDVYDFNNWTSVIMKINGEPKEIILQRLNSNELPYITYGGKYNKDDKNAIVCPENFYSIETIKDIDRNNVYNLNEILGEKIQLEYYDYKPTQGESPHIIYEEENELHQEQFEVVGLYKNGKVLNEVDGCFINPIDFERIRDIQHSEVYNARREIQAKSGTTSFNVVVDKIANIDKVIEELEQKNMKVSSSKVELDEETYNLFFTIAFCTMTFSLFTIIMITLFYAKKKMIREEQNIRLMLTEGFTKREVGHIYSLEMFIQNSFIYLISLIIFILLFVLSINKISYLIYIDLIIGLKLSILNFIILFIIVVILPTTVIYLKTTKLKNISNR